MNGTRTPEKIAREVEVIADKLRAHEASCLRCRIGKCAEADQLADLMRDLTIELGSIPEVQAEGDEFVLDLLEERLDAEEEWE